MKLCFFSAGVAFQGLLVLLYKYMALCIVCTIVAQNPVNFSGTVIFNMLIKRVDCEEMCGKMEIRADKIVIGSKIK